MIYREQYTVGDDVVRLDYLCSGDVESVFISKAGQTMDFVSVCERRLYINDDFIKTIQQDCKMYLNNEMRVE